MKKLLYLLFGIALFDTVGVYGANTASLSPKLDKLVNDFVTIANGNNVMDVHKFDILFDKNMDIVMSYLNNTIKPQDVMTIQQIKNQMTIDLNKCENDFVAENDLVPRSKPKLSLNSRNPQYLTQAFNTLSTKNKALIPLFTLVYTMINLYGDQWLRNEMLASFISNVNKFKGKECYKGFRNRILHMFCIAYPYAPK